MQAVLKKWDELSTNYPNFNVLAQTFIVFLIFMVVLSLVSEHFFTSRNLTIIAVQVAYYVILAVGMTLVMTTAGIDISIGSMLALTTAFLGELIMGQGYPVWMGITIAIIAGIVAGAINGFFIVKLKVPPIITTLGTFASFRGFAYYYLDGTIYYNFPPEFLFIARGSVLGIPLPIIIATVFLVGGHYFLAYTKTGREITALGSNEQAARLAGISVGRLKLLVYAIMGFCVGVASLIVTARLDSATALVGGGVEIHTIAAVVVGGTALFGGKGLMIGSLLGVLILGTLENGLLLAGLGYYWQRVLLGVLFVSVVASRTAREKQV